MHDNAINNVHFFKSVTSTNDIAKQSEEAEAVFVADEQTAGKGSKGRVWQSSLNEGLYMSFLVRPRIEAPQIPGITLMCAVVVCNAIEAVCDIKCSIKWPNDILAAGKKICGILTESVFGADGVERVVCGIGINTNQHFGGELSDKAASLGIRTKKQKMVLCNCVINGFFESYDKYLEEGLSAFMPEFERRNAVSGVVKLTSMDEEFEGTPVGFDESGAILIDIDGETRRFVAGEISLRGENGYV